MDEKTREKLDKKGWNIGTTRDFLGLSDEEMQIVELRSALGRMLREKRTAIGLTQTLLAERIGSSQSRVAKMETGDSSVSIDLILRSLFRIGASNRDICNYVSRL